MIGWLDCSSGASGDMMLGALVDAGVPLSVLQDAIDCLSVEHVSLTSETVLRHGIGATHVTVECPPTEASRRWADIRGLLTTAPDLDDEVRRLALDVFARLARAEAAVHRVDVDDVHFHEVGGLDAIADIVGACAGFAWLRSQGLTTLVVSPVALGSGRAHGMHGVIPVPGPAVLALLEGAPVSAGPAEHEMCTPTGAALIAALADSFGVLPPLTVARVGYGAGTRDLAEVPNLLRLVLGDPPASNGSSTAVVLEANIDDLDPRVWPAALSALFEAGASDAWLSPITMKKGRPAYTLHVLCAPTAVDTVRVAIFTHTSTIGLRLSTVDKVALERSESTVDVDGQPVRIKTSSLDGVAVNLSVEYEDVAAAATQLGLPVKAVLARATAAAHGTSI